MNFNEIRNLAQSALHTTVRIHRKNGTYMVYKNGVMVYENSDWNLIKEIALAR
jgi:hypothetical protein